MEQAPIPRWQVVTGWVLSGILAFVFLPCAFFKIAQPADFLEEWTKTYPAGAALPLGVIEATLFVLYLVPKTRYLGGLLMLAYLGGAVATHLHAGDGLFFVPVLVGVVGWLGLYLRDRKLRALVPDCRGLSVGMEMPDGPVSFGRTRVNHIAFRPPITTEE